jgi:heptosyltransferase II
MNNSFLIIQTAFTGDVILATALVEKIHIEYPGAVVDMLVRKGNESLLYNNPKLRNILVWNKTDNKNKNLLKLLQQIRKNKYETVINLQRFGATGMLTALSGAKNKTGFNKNPFSFFFTKKIKHEIRNGIHEIHRNQKLLSDLPPALPRIYPSPADEELASKYKTENYITISPGSVWFTKTLPPYKWVELIRLHKSKDETVKIFMLGSASEKTLAEEIKKESGFGDIVNLAGTTTYLQSAALMKDAVMNYVNDSAPMHLASAVNARVTTVYCSTVPEFGFGPLSDFSRIIETKILLNCRPCGLHGYAKCPLGHFNCAHTIETNSIISW